ncbi:vitamin K epoxide reductase family protein [Actinokineospora bangkokensis]|uniref:Vitamin K epoxide reductase n=1 Tax=Actinokineospora bangkokensis TaxID=1193682 RepID=A0A1Q9LK78_9PSEU|nr:vitamin K epoxide reductase family protein [Actinokineospora bangkokensis]OLR92420.1 vitamin K epoxide reductase [Actinokineospora bangkokensis]
MAEATGVVPAPQETGAPPLSRGLSWWWAVGGALGLLAAGALTLEKIAKLRDPSYVPSCTLGKVFACGTVMDSPQAAAFGFPNPLIGLAAFSVVVTVGVVGLIGFAPPRWFRVGMWAGTAFGVGFVHWLIASSLFEIHALCPYCMVVWAVTIALFLHTSVDTWPALAGLRRVRGSVLAIWYAAVLALVVTAFWDDWSTLFS